MGVVTRVLGLDLSLTSTGVVVLGSAGGEVVGVQESLAIKSKLRGEARLEEIRERVMAIVDLFNPTLIILEGYAFGRANQMAALGELSGVIKHALHLEGRPFLIVPPTRLKKYVCGKGNAKKDQVRLGVFKRWGFEAPTNDEVDAYGLARIGLAYLGCDTDLIKAQEEVIKDLKKGK